ncbi:MAG: hypothetical protein J6L77_01500 [Coprococcus sp.]|nr:hypothetical protein [Coprococcus sp.]
MSAKNFRKIICMFFSVMVLVLLNGCTTPEEQAKIDADNKMRAEKIAEEYFDEDFQYDFDFYGGGGEGDLSAYIYVFTDGNTINCVAIPATEDDAGPFVYYDCTLHQYDSGRWSILKIKDSDKVD